MLNKYIVRYKLYHIMSHYSRVIIDDKAHQAEILTLLGLKAS